MLLVLLTLQVSVPLVRLTGASARVAFFAWLATFPMMIAVAWLNRRERGLPLLGLGLLLNLIVIGLNGGMPVFESAVRIATASAQTAAIPLGDFAHILGGVGTRLPWLADVVPMPGPDWLRIVVSPGDLLLFAGIVVFVGAEASSKARSSA
jgi:hypothetical protein